MPRVKKVKKSTAKNQASKTKILLSSQDLKQNLSSQLHISESYVSLLLGAIVVLGLSALFLIFLTRGNNNLSVPQDESQTPTTKAMQEKTYVLQEGEYLWDVAVKFYGDGFRWVDIAKASKLENPDYVPPGTKLIIPNAK